MNKLYVKMPILDYQAEEAYKSLRTNIQFCGSDIKTIAITSCTPDEGKSTVCLHLAAYLAEAGKKSVLVDADMRKSILHRKIESQESEIFGLAHYLAGQKTLNEVLNTTDLPNLYMIISGHVPPNPSELLASRKFTDMLSSLRKAFDYVIVDTPPLGSVVDAAIVTKECDGAVLVIESGHVSYRFAQDIADQLQKTETPLLGTILNKVDLKKGSPYYGRYYGRYYGKYYGKYYGNYYGNPEDRNKKASGGKKA